MTTEELGGRLRLIRNARDLSQEEAGKPIHADQTKMSNMELGKSNPCFMDILTLSRTMHFSLDVLAAEKFDLHRCLLD